MRVFATGTGRCGTSTFYQLARTVHGMTAGHESMLGRLPTWEFPEQHFEVASQLVIGIPFLCARYPDARWIHLVREREACVHSLARECWRSMEAFGWQWYGVEHPADVYRAAGEFYDRTNELIEALLPDAPRIVAERLERHWPEICRWLEVEYEQEAAAEILRRRYNPGSRRGRDNFIEA